MAAPDEASVTEKESPETAQPDGLPEKIRRLHAAATGGAQPADPHEVLMDEVAMVTRHYQPDVDPGRFRGLHTAYLKQLDSLVARGLTGEELTNRINELAVDTQKKLARTVGEESYERLMGVRPNEQLLLTEPEPSSVAGHPVPPHAQRFSEPEPVRD